MSYVLIVEDQAPIARLLHTWVQAEGLDPVMTSGAEQALLLASEQPPAVVLCDIRLPGGRDGFWLIEHLRVLHPAAAIVMTTGMHEFDAAVAGMRAGAVDYVLKPFTRDRVVQALQRALDQYQSRAASLGAPPDERPQGEHAGRATAKAALLSVLHAQGGTAVEHAERVARLAVKLARTLKCDEQAVSQIEHAVLLCEVTRLDVHGVARRLPQLAEAATIAVASQERFDGRGFPLGLKGHAIPRGAQIVAVASAYTDLTSARAPAPLTPADALATLCGERGGEFDPAVLGALRLEGPVHHVAAGPDTWGARPDTRGAIEVR